MHVRRRIHACGEEDTYEEKDIYKSVSISLYTCTYEEEDTCMSYEEEHVCVCLSLTTSL